LSYVGSNKTRRLNFSIRFPHIIKKLQADHNLKILKGLTWWTANRTHPYIIKGGIQGNNYQISKLVQ